MTTRAHEIRERLVAARNLIEDYDLEHWWFDGDGVIEASVDDTAYLLARVEELETALKPLADTKIRGETVTEIVSTIIETTGDGPFADWIAELLTGHTKAARTALETHDED